MRIRNARQRRRWINWDVFLRRALVSAFIIWGFVLYGLAVYGALRLIGGAE